MIKNVFKIMIALVLVASIGLLIASSEAPSLPEPALKNTNIAKAYAYAEDNQEFLSQIPCTCGCEWLNDHKSNYNCYFTAEGDYDNHGAYCNICVGITLDAATMRQTGSSISEIVAYVYATYPPNREPGSD